MSVESCGEIKNNDDQGMSFFDRFFIVIMILVSFVFVPTFIGMDNNYGFMEMLTIVLSFYSLSYILFELFLVNYLKKREKYPYPEIENMYFIIVSSILMFPVTLAYLFFVFELPFIENLTKTISFFMLIYLFVSISDFYKSYTYKKLRNLLSERFILNSILENHKLTNKGYYLKDNLNNLNLDIMKSRLSFYNFSIVLLTFSVFYLLYLKVYFLFFMMFLPVCILFAILLQERKKILKS